MSNDSELVLAGYDAWNRGDLDAWLELVHPEVEFHSSGVFPDLDPVYRGHEGIVEVWRQLREPWEAFTIDIEQIEEEGDCFTVAVRLRAKGADSGVDIDLRFGHAIRLRDGLGAVFVARRTAEEAREVLRQTKSTTQAGDRSTQRTT